VKRFIKLFFFYGSRFYTTCQHHHEYRQVLKDRFRRIKHYLDNGLRLFNESRPSIFKALCWTTILLQGLLKAERERIAVYGNSCKALLHGFYAAAHVPITAAIGT
jgi:hypothetical protein